MIVSGGPTGRAAPPWPSTRRPVLVSRPGICSSSATRPSTTSGVRGTGSTPAREPRAGAGSCGSRAGRSAACLTGDWSPRAGYEAGRRLAAPTRRDRGVRRQRPDGPRRAAGHARSGSEGARRGQRGRLRRHARVRLLHAAAHDRAPGPPRGRPSGVELVLSIIAGEALEQHLAVPPELVVRRTTAAPPPARRWLGIPE